VNIIKTTAMELLDSAGRAAGITPQRSTLPILSNMLISKSGHNHKFIGSDSDIQVECTASLGGDDDRMATTVQAAKLLSLLKSLPSDQVVTLATDGAKLSLRAGRSKFTLQTMPAQDFPTFREDATTTGQFVLPESVLASLIDQTQYAMASQDTQPQFNGMFLELKGQQLTAVASDGKRMAMARVTLAESFEDQEAIIPRKTVLELRKLLGTTDKPVSVKLSLINARFEFGDVIFLTRLVSGKYVTYERAIPKNLAHCVPMNRIMLLSMMKRAALIIDDKVKTVRFKFSQGLVTILSASLNHDDGEQEAEIDYTGPDETLGIPIAQFIDCLTSFTHELVRFNFTDGKTSSMLTFAEEPEFRYLLGAYKV